MVTEDMIMNTVYLEPTPTNEPCTQTTTPATNAITDNSMSAEHMLTIIIPVAVFAIVLCAVIVGVGILCCYIIVARKSTGKRYNIKARPSYLLSFYQQYAINNIIITVNLELLHYTYLSKNLAW